MKYLLLVKISYWRKERIKCDILPKNIKKREREREDETQRVILLNKVRLCKDKAF